jgi:hypothetical protein
MKYTREELFEMAENSNTIKELSIVTDYAHKNKEIYGFADFLTIVDLISIRKHEIDLFNNLES